jgi:hypothetical protein
VHGVTRPLGDDVAQQRLSNESQISDQIESLVAATFILKPQSAGIENAGAIEAWGRPVGVTVVGAEMFRWIMRIPHDR